MSCALPKVVGYSRVSTDDQAKDGHSLKDQPIAIRAYAVAQGLDLVEVVEDAGECSKTLDRPGLQRILTMLRSGEVAGVVIYHLDRLTRHVGDMTHLVEEYFTRPDGHHLYSCSQPVDTRTASGRMLVYIQIVVSQYQRESTVERTASTMSGKRARGERLGNLPYGKQLSADGVTLEPLASEVYVLYTMRELRDQGWPLRSIAAELDRLELKTRTGKPWSPSSIAAILKRAEG